ncbi:MAG: DUF411 domain-containing protein [Proteobacteria bacterium]|jgi:hypothetical protein|nr:DUF411 domain-containing protein [Pseudomonadota bacterium]
MINRRYFSGALAVLCTTPVGAANRPNMTMHRSPTCGCCGAWAAYIRRAGFSITIVNESDLAPIKSRAGVPDALQSCHTAFIDGYVVEGHVPVEAIEKMLSERPAITGIAVPEMPTGSPGMEIPMMKPEPFKVIAFSQMGSSETFMDYPNGFIAGR